MIRPTDITVLLCLGRLECKCLDRFASRIKDMLCGEVFRVRFVAVGENSNTGCNIVCAHPYVTFEDGLLRQVRELVAMPFSNAPATPDKGLAFVLGEKTESAERVVFVVSESREFDYDSAASIVKQLRESGVLVRFISPDSPEKVRAVMVERSAGYHHVMVRREGMSLVLRYSSQYGPQEKAFNNYIVAELLSFNEEINVDRFLLPESEGGFGWSLDRISDLYRDVLWNNPQIFYVNKIYSIRYLKNDSTGAVSNVRICKIPYAIGKNEYALCKAELETAARKALKCLEGIDDSVEKALILHDYIVRNCEYDMRGVDNPSPVYRTAYDVLVRHRAVCEGYVMAYRYLLALAGIESEEVESDAMRHCWSYLHLNGNWYHVDVTWDDPVYGSDGADVLNKFLDASLPISHEYFLLSDNAIKEKEHYDWTVRGLPPATDTRFDNETWDTRRRRV